MIVRILIDQTHLQVIPKFCENLAVLDFRSCPVPIAVRVTSLPFGMKQLLTMRALPSWVLTIVALDRQR